MKIKNKKLYALFKSFLCFVLVFAMIIPSVAYAGSGGSQGGGSNTGGGQLPNNPQAKYHCPGMGLSILLII